MAVDGKGARRFLVTNSQEICLMGTAILSRFALNTARRFVYPFAPALSRGLGVPLSAITSLIAVNQATTLLGAGLAPLGDVWGPRAMMLAGLTMLAIGMLAGGLISWYWIVLVAIFLAGLGKSVFDPALQAYIGEHVPFERRGMAIGLSELSWAGSSLIGIPAAGLLIDRYTWRAPFFAISLVALLGIIALMVLLPRQTRAAVGRHGAREKFGIRWRHVVRSRVACSALCYAFLFNAANDMLFVVYGAWLEHAFALSLVAVGLSTGVIGLAEFGGEALTVFLADRIGLNRVVLCGLICVCASYGALPVVSRTLPLALGALFVLFITFEFTIVTSLSLFTEILPEARATMMAGYLAFAGLGRIFGALLGGALWRFERISLICLVAAGMTGLAWGALFWGFRRSSTTDGVRVL